MRVERIKAATMREALDKIKLKLGDDAVILNTRTTKEGIEVIAARDQEQQKTGNSWLDEVIQKDQELRSKLQPKPQTKPRKSSPTLGEIESYSRAGSFDINSLVKESEEKPAPEVKSVKEPEKVKVEPKVDDAFIKELEKQRIQQIEEATQTAKEFSQLLKEELKTTHEQRKIWIEHEKQLDSLKKQLVDLKESILRQELSELKKRADELKKQKQEQNSAPQTIQNDESLKIFYKNINKRLIDRGVDKATAEEIVATVEKKCTDNKWNFDSSLEIQELKTLIIEELKKNIKVYNPKNEGAQIISLIGPEKSGKTLTSMKIALKTALFENKKVALILVSDKQEKSIQHLNQLSLATKLPIAIISGVDDLKNALKIHSDKDQVVIDFAVSDIEVLKTYLKEIKKSQVYLTLSMVMAVDEFKSISKQYAKTDFNAIILTHLDKIKKIGTVIGISNLMQKPLSYLGNGSIIPDDVDYANESKLSHMILKG